MRHSLLLALVLVAFGARGSNISDELSVTNSQETPANPRSSFVTESLLGSIDLSDQWTLDLGAALTLEGKTAAAERGQFGSSGSAVTVLSAGVDYAPDDHWTTGVSFDFSPQSTQFAGTELQITTARGATSTAQTLVRSTSSNLSEGVNVSYDTAGDSDLEWSFGGSLQASQFGTDQAITRVRYGNGALTPAQLLALCRGSARRCPTAILHVLGATPATLDSERLQLDATATLDKDTDLTLSGSYYHYEQDPAQVGLFGFESVRQSVSGGNGLPIAPLQYLIRPEVTRRAGDFSVKLWVQAGQYVAGTGQSTAGIGARLQYRFTRAFKLWLIASGENDVDDQGMSSKSGTLAMGAGYRF